MPATHTGPGVQIRVEILLLMTARVRSQAPQWYEFSDGCFKRFVQGQLFQLAYWAWCLEPTVLSHAHKNILISFKIRGKNKLLS